VFALLALAAPANASRTQTMSFEAPSDLLNPATREAAFEQLDTLGVHAIRVLMYWRDVAPQPNSPTKPDFDTTDPASYNWGNYDGVVDAADARGWKVLLTVTGPEPKWATESKKDQVTRPKPEEFAPFMAAVGKHFSGRVSQYSIWNEPNHPQFLQPQFDSKHNPESPTLYRALFKAALKGLRSAAVPNPQVLFGETAPRGGGKVVAPLTFLRGALCLDSKYKLKSGCGAIDMAGYAHHAYTTSAGPLFKPPSKNDVTIGVLSRLTGALDKAARAHAILPNMPVYLTEFGIQSVPDPISGVSLQQQAEYRSISERIAYDNPRVKAFSQYLLTDDKPIAGATGAAKYGGFESGLKTSKGQDKPSLAAFRLPLAIKKESSTAVSAWGLVRPALAATSVVLEYRAGASGAWHTLKTLPTNALGYFRSRVSYRNHRQYRLVWTSPAGGTYTGAATRAYK
jgi:hypothetical protein